MAELVKCLSQSMKTWVWFFFLKGQAWWWVCRPPEAGYLKNLGQPMDCRSSEKPCLSNKVKTQDNDTCCGRLSYQHIRDATPSKSQQDGFLSKIWIITSPVSTDTDVWNFTGLHSFGEELQMINGCQEGEIFSFRRNEPPDNLSSPKWSP